MSRLSCMAWICVIKCEKENGRVFFFFFAGKKEKKAGFSGGGFHNRHEPSEAVLDPFLVEELTVPSSCSQCRHW